MALHYKRVRVLVSPELIAQIRKSRDARLKARFSNASPSRVRNGLSVEMCVVEFGYIFDGMQPGDIPADVLRKHLAKEPAA